MKVTNELLNREFYLLILRRLIFRKCFRKIVLQDRYVSFLLKIILIHRCSRENISIFILLNKYLYFVFVLEIL